MSSKEEAKQLMKELEEIETQIMEHESTLKANNIGMDEPLTDDQDYPLPNVDVYAVRNARGKIRCLQNDKIAKTEEIEKKLTEIHQSNAKGGGEERGKEEEEEKTVHRTSNDPFVQVDKVFPDSPASQTGLRDGDLIVQFGPLHADVFQKLDQLKELVMASINKPIRVTLLRNIRVHHLQLTPKNWSGNGLIGCSFTVIEKKDTKRR